MCIKINYSILYYFKNTKIYFQGNKTSYHEPPLYIGVIDDVILFDSFSLLNKCRLQIYFEKHCIVMGGIQAS